MSDVISVDDLDLIFIRTQDENGRWANISIRDATDKQMSVWAASREIIMGTNSQWSLQERAEFCTFTHQHRPLVILRREALAADE